MQNLYLTGCNLSRSVSSAGEHQSDQFINPPNLPRRAETFGGYDHNAAALARLLQKFTSSSANNVISTTSTTITTCSPSTITTNTIIDKLVESSNAQETKSSDQEKQAFEKQAICEDNEKRESLNTDKANSPSILLNTVLPMQDPNDLVSQLSTLPLLVSQLEHSHSRNSVDSEMLNSVTIPQSKHEQVIQIVELQHQLNLILCLFYHQQTLFELMRLNLQDNIPTATSSSLNQQQQLPTTSASTLALNTLSTTSRTNISSISPSTNTQSMHPQITSSNALPTASLTSSLNKKFRAENQLEELRNLHEQFSTEKQSFEKRTKELDKREALLKQEKEDLVEQRENLYRKLENLQDELGICLGSGGLSSSAKLANIQASLNLSAGNKQSDTYVNEQQQTTKPKTASQTRTRLSSGDLPVKQQIPLKLATENANNQLSMSKSCNNSPNISPSITFDLVNCLQSSSKKSSVNYSTSSSTATPSSPSRSIKVGRKESNQSSNQNPDQPPIDSSTEDKNEEEIFC